MACKMKIINCVVLFSFILGLFVNLNVGENVSCNKRTFSDNSFVCVCNSTYCDYADNPEIPENGTYNRVISSRDVYRLFSTSGTLLTDQAPGNTTIRITLGQQNQEINGFGGAFTDAAGINVAQLSEESQNNYIRSYFAHDGIQYSVGRIPIAGSDFSTHAYSYDDVDGDVDLEYFSLAPEDFNYKIPYMQKALEIAAKEILFFGSPWAPPAWMKVNGMANGTGGLLPEMWQPYSNYLVKFVQEYEKNNVSIWGMTPQNEPLTGFEDWPWNTCAWSAEDMRDWIKGNLGPTLTAAGLRRIKLMVLDHNRDALPWYPQTILEDPVASQYVDGIAVHWYADNNVFPDVLTETQLMFPDKFMMYTEACEGWDTPLHVKLGNWDRAQNYVYNIMDDLNNYMTGWVDWNMALSMSGGPNWANNFVDSPVIVNPEVDEFYKQPMFYAMGHFSKYIERGALRLNTTVEGTNSWGVRSVGFINPDDSYVIVILNTNEETISTNVKIDTDHYVVIDLNPKSIETIIVSI